MRYACRDCRRKFRTEGALEMHDRAKHKDRVISRAQHTNRGSFLGSFIGALVAVLIGGAALVVSSSRTQERSDANSLTVERLVK